MIAVFVDQHVRQQRFGRHAAIDRTLGRGGLAHRLFAAPAAVARPADDADTQLGRHVIQHFRTVFADHMHRAAATGTRLILDIDDQFDPRKMRRQRAAVALRRFGARRGRRGIRF